MKDLKPTCKIAVVQAAPIMFDKAACTEKAVSLIQECALKNAELIVFPELFIPGYPYGMTFGFSVGRRTEEGRKDWMLYYRNSILVPGEETRLLGEAAKKAHAWVSIGVSERDAVTATLYNSNLVFSPDGELVFCHRKLKPTGSERVVWGDADKAYFPVAETPWGPMGSMICWESPSTFLPTPTTTRNGRPPSAILPLRATASLSTATCISPAICIRRDSAARRRSTACPRPYAAEEAVSSILTAIF